MVVTLLAGPGARMFLWIQNTCLDAPEPHLCLHAVGPRSVMSRPLG